MILLRVPGMGEKRQKKSARRMTWNEIRNLQEIRSVKAVPGKTVITRQLCTCQKGMAGCNQE